MHLELIFRRGDLCCCKLNDFMWLHQIIFDVWAVSSVAATVAGIVEACEVKSREDLVFELFAWCAISLNCIGIMGRKGIGN